MSNRHLVSVIIPAYNYARYIPGAVNSVLAQTYQDYEIVVVDDGSTDDTRQALGDSLHKITYVYQQNRGVSAARNVGLERSHGELIAFLDADDSWVPDKLDRQVRFLRDHTTIGLVCSGAEHINDGEGDASPTSPQPLDCSIWLNNGVIVKDAFSVLLETNFIITSTVVIRRECIRKVGTFDESLRSVEDRDLWLRTARHFPIAYMPGAVVQKRSHPNNLSADGTLCTQSRIRVLEKVGRERVGLQHRDRVYIRKRLAFLYFELGTMCQDTDNYRLARKHFRASLMKKVQLDPLLFYLASFINKSVTAWLISLKRRYGTYLLPKRLSDRHIPEHDVIR
jgi:glycosyltransferase involved in cell wall biosynthesis